MKKFSDFLTEVKNYKAHEGESEVLHNVSFDKVDKFKPLSFFGKSPIVRSVHDSYKDKSYKGAGKKPELNTVRLKLGKMEDVKTHPNYRGGDFTSDWGLHHLHQTGRVSEKGLHDLFNKAPNDSEKRNSFVADHLRKHGIDTLRNHYATTKSGNHHEYIITHPDQVRVLRKSSTPKFNASKGM